MNFQLMRSTAQLRGIKLLLVLSFLLIQSTWSIPPTLKSSIDGYKTVCPGEALCGIKLLLVVSFLLIQSTWSIPPTLKSSIDGYKTVCPGEAVYFTCNVQTSNSLTWRSFHYIGNNTVIEFNRDLDRLGDGKSTSLPNRETTLLQLSSLTDRELEATLRIVIVSSVVNASVSCANDVSESKQQILLLTETPEAPVLGTNSSKFYQFSLKPPPNDNRVDIDFYRVTAIGSGFNESYILSNYTSEYMIPSTSYVLSQNISLEVVAVDRCGQRSPAAMIAIPADNLSSQPSNCSIDTVRIWNSGYHCQFNIFILLMLLILLHAF